jgi:hypothetical protein
MTALDTPSAIQARLGEIDDDLAVRQNAYESAARNWFKAKRNREHDRAVAFISAGGTVAERNAIADRETATDGRDAEAEFEAIKAVVKVLETRANIGMALLKSQGRA